MTKEALDFQVNNGICEGYGCFRKTTTKISVKVGHLGSISLDLCSNCAEKFDEKDLACPRQSQSQRLGVENNEVKELHCYTDILDEKTSSQTGSSYVTCCQVCGWYGYPQEKIIIEFKGIRAEEEDGYVDIFNEYNYETAGEKRTKHIHKYNPKLVHEAVDVALTIRDGGD